MCATAPASAERVILLTHNTRSFALVLGALVAVGSTAAADDRAARQLYKEGLAHYNVAEFDEAIAKFKQAYTLSTEPELLFNIGQAYRFKRPPDCTRTTSSVVSFERTSREPHAIPRRECTALRHPEHRHGDAADVQ